MQDGKVFALLRRRRHTAIWSYTFDLIAGDAVERCRAFVGKTLVLRHPRNPGHPQDCALVIHDPLSEYVECRSADVLRRLEQCPQPGDLTEIRVDTGLQSQV